MIARGAPPPRSAAALAAFFVSGCAGLVYEVAWIRRASLVFGSTTLALATVLAVFFLGLAIGSFVFGRIASRVARPLRLFAMLELTIGALALASLPAFNVAERIYSAAYPVLVEHRALLFLGRVVIAAVVLIPPTILMGGTLPLLCRQFVASPDRIARSVALLYGVNTLGAVVGCAAAGLALLPALGLRGTIACGAALSVAAAAIALARRAAPAPAALAEAAAPRPTRPTRGSTFLQLAFFFSGFVAVGSEVLWTRFLGLRIHNTVTTYTITLCVVLGGIVIGSLLAGARFDRARARGFTFGLLHAASALAVLAIMLMPPLVWDRLGPGLWTFVLLLLPPSILSGAAFPLGVRMLVDRPQLASVTVGRVVAINTLGGIVGSFAVGFAGLPLLGMQTMLRALTATSLAIGCGAWLFIDDAPRQPRRPRRAALALAAAAALAWIAIPRALPTRIPHDHLSGDARLVDVAEGLTSNVAVIQGAGFLRMEIDRLWQGESRKNHQCLAAHIPMLLHPAPRRALVVGAGAGQTPARFLMHDIEHLDCVDIEPAVFDMIREHFDARWMSDPRVRIVSDDGRSFLAHTPATYDVISLEAGQIHRPGVANFYTRDFYEAARARLNPGGMLSQFLPLPDFAPDDFRGAVRTFLDVFPNSMLWYNTSELLLIGVNGDSLRLDAARVRERLSRGAVAEDLAYRHWGSASRNLNDPGVFFASFLMGPAGLRSVSDSGVIFTDDHPRLDYAAARVPADAMNEIPIVDLLRPRLESAADAFSFGSAIAPGDSATIREIQNRNVSDIVARAYVRRATLLLTTGDAPAIVAAVEAAVRANPEMFLAQRMLAESRVLQGRVDDAIAHYAEAMRIRDDDPIALRGMGLALLDADRAGEAIPRLQAAVALDPDDAQTQNNLGVALGMQGRFDEGLRAIEAALRLRPDYPGAHDNLARMRAAIGAPH